MKAPLQNADLLPNFSSILECGKHRRHRVIYIYIPFLPSDSFILSLSQEDLHCFRLPNRHSRDCIHPLRRNPKVWFHISYSIRVRVYTDLCILFGFLSPVVRFGSISTILTVCILLVGFLALCEIAVLLMMCSQVCIQAYLFAGLFLQIYGAIS